MTGEHNAAAKKQVLIPPPRSVSRREAKGLCLVLLTIAALSRPTTAQAQIEPQPHREEVDRQTVEEPPQPVLTRAPEVAVYVDPEYPDELRDEDIEGEVILLVTISAEGIVSAVEVVESQDARLSGLAMDAAWMLEFIPAEVDHVPAPVQIEFGYVFALDVRDLREREAATREAEGKEGALESEGMEAGEGSAQPSDREELARDTQDTGLEAQAQSESEPTVTISGHALVRGLRDPIDGAMVISGDEVATTDSEGYFELRLEPGRSHLIEVRAPGFHPFETAELIEEGERNEVVYYVQRRGDSPYETVVRAPRPRKEVSRIVLSRDEAQRVPGTFGDPLRVVENLPGMARAPFIGGQLLVRGSRPEDTGVLFDGVMIPMLYHFGGLTSVVNAEFIEEIDFLPGGFGSEYGRASGGVVDVTPRRLIGEPARGSAKVDLMDTSLFYRRPIGDSLAVGVAVRRSYVDVFLPVVMNALGNTSDAGRITLAPVYSDYQVKADWNPAPDHDLDLFFFGSRDTLALLASGSLQMHAVEFDMRLDFHRAMLGHRWRITKDLVLRTRPFVGLTRQGAGGGQEEVDLAFDVDMHLYEAGFRQDLTWRASDLLTLRTGLDIYGLRGTGFIDVPVPIDLLSFPSPMEPLPENQVFDATDGATAGGLWTEAVIEWANLQLVPGLRLEVYRLPEAVTPVLEPRISARYGLLEGTVLKGAAGIYHKPPTIIEANPVVGNPSLRPERARHLVAGVEQRLTDILELDLQIFHNRHTDLVVSASPSEVEDGEARGETFVNGGDGRAYGAELLLRHKITPRAFGWLAYTLMRSERRSRPEDDYRITGYDQTHILTLVGSYRLGRGFEIGARFRLVSGNPYTPIVDAYHDLDSDRWRPLYGPSRSERLPMFHQLDLRAEYTRTFDTFTISAYLDLLNAYNQGNVEDFQYDYRYRNRVDFNGLPIFPVLGVRGQW